jgi:ribonuclease P protein component
VRSGQIALKYMPSNRASYRLAVVVSKKVSKSAVVRNRIRRRVIEAVRLRAAEITKPYDIVVTVFQDTLAIMPAQELDQTVRNLLQQAGIIGR